MNSRSDEMPVKRGRPRDPARMQRVLKAAAAQFLQQGFAATSMESIAKASGVSKMTIYNYFPTKEALFEACVAHRTDDVFHLSKLYQAGAQLPAPKVVLHQIATQFVALMRDPEVLGMHRILIGNAGQHPEICHSFLEQGCLRLHQQVKGYLELAHHAGLLCAPDAQLASDQFLALCLGRQHLKALLMLGVPSAAEDRAMIADNVAMFLQVYATTAKTSS